MVSEAKLLFLVFRLVGSSRGGDQTISKTKRIVRKVKNISHPIQKVSNKSGRSCRTCISAFCILNHSFFGTQS